MAWWEGLSPEQVMDVLERQRGGEPVSMAEVREWLSMEAEGQRRVPAHAQVSVYILYDAARAGGPAITIPAGTVFTDGVGLMRFILPAAYTLQPNDGVSVVLLADFTGEEYNVAADTIDRIAEPMDLNDLWNAGALLIHQAQPATGGSGPSARLAARQRAMDELALDSRIAERYRASAHQGASLPVVRYTLGIDMAEGADSTIQWNMTSASSTDFDMPVQFCEIDETCQGGVEAPPREPTLKEVWND